MIISIKIRDMRVDFYTYDVRNLGQAEGAHKVGASARTSKTDQNACVLCRERSVYLILGRDAAATD